MSDSDDIAAWIHDTLAAYPVHPCLLLVHLAAATLRFQIDDLADRTGWPICNLGAELSRRLLDVPAPHRPAHAPIAASEILAANAPGPVLCTDIDLLFDPSLSLDPLALLRQASRRVALIVAWPGSYGAGVLTYAVPEHSHFHRYPRPDLCAGCIRPLS